MGGHRVFELQGLGGPCELMALLTWSNAVSPDIALESRAVFPKIVPEADEAPPFSEAKGDGVAFSELRNSVQVLTQPVRMVP